MAGHSKWANIKHRKGVQDIRKGQVRTRILREIMVAVQEGGSVPMYNARLRVALQNARGANVPKGNIRRAMERAGGVGVARYIHATYEGYGPHGVGVMVEVMTDNLNRTVGGVRAAFNKHHGSLGKHGSLRHLFVQEGVFVVAKEKVVGEEAMMLAMIDAGVACIEEDGSCHYLIAPMRAFGAVQQALEAKGIGAVSATLRHSPVTGLRLAHAAAAQVVRLLDALEELDDVQGVYHNLLGED